jgi:mRNA-degrading endonuclease RelE of RelBE toxin-antitoxin system
VRTAGSDGTLMFQVVFNDISAAEMAALPTELQLDLLCDFEVLPEELEKADPDRFGVIEREGKRLFRYRVKDYRIYFERVSEGVTVHRVLHKNTFRDFLFRASLPMPTEDVELSGQRKFWELIEAGRAARRT